VGGTDSTVTAGTPRHAPGARRRPELAAFLRSRRARVTPRDVGMAPGLRHRTPCLRREEVAQLSGVGVTWYTWLEQGSPINASPQVLDAVSRTLRLQGAEREHLYRLAGAAYDEGGGEAAWPGSMGEDVRDVIDALRPRVAAVYDGRYDIPAANAAYRGVFQSDGRVLGSRTRRRGRARAARSCRTAASPTASGPTRCAPCSPTATACGRSIRTRSRPWSWRPCGARTDAMSASPSGSVVHGMSARSPLFTELRQRGDVVPPRTRVKGFRHARVGEVYLRSLWLTVDGMPECRIVTCTPADAESARRVDRLVAAART
jgi:hypothetical protein